MPSTGFTAISNKIDGSVNHLIDCILREREEEDDSDEYPFADLDEAEVDELDAINYCSYSNF